MILDLDTDVWTEILEGLDLRRVSFLDCQDSDAATRLGKIIESLEMLGNEVVGGRLEAYRIKIAPDKVVEIRLLPTGSSH